jgi:heme-degrading monooxygenase HmoA
MILVLFEVTVRKCCRDDNLALAAKLNDELAKSEGFLRSERFSSLANEGKLLSLSVWESEEAVERWRNQTEHRMSQRHGRDSIFESYTITVASSLRRYSHTDRSEAPEDSNRFFGLSGCMDCDG